MLKCVNIGISVPKLYEFSLLVMTQTRLVFGVNYYSHSSRGAARGQLRIPGWF